jgi:hypothetical protein
MPAARITTRLAVAAALVFVVLLPAAPTSGAAIDRQEVGFSLTLLDFFGATPTHDNEQVIKTQNGYFGFPSGGSPLFCCQAGAVLDWIVVVDQARAVVSGEWAISGNPDDRLWLGDLHGRTTPAGGSGAITGTANTGETFRGTWTFVGSVDPTTGHELTLQVVGVVTS